MNGSVTVAMSADPMTIWGVLSDVTRIGEFSPETFEAQWLDGAAGPALGAGFRGHVKRNGIGPIYWTTCKVIECEPGKSFGFAVVQNDKPINTWTYRITAREGGADVTESFELAPVLPLKAYWAIAGRRRGKRNERGMQQTLERVKAAAESHR
jgi:hypothetical protein